MVTHARLQNNPVVYGFGALSRLFVSFPYPSTQTSQGTRALRKKPLFPESIMKAVCWSPSSAILFPRN